MSDSANSNAEKNQSIATNDNNTCRVCGDQATIINYGALSCLSCRTFFRRNAYPTKKIPTCRYNSECPVTVSTRRFCAACRLGTCLSVGMSSDLIRKEDLARAKLKAKNQEQNLTTMTTSQSSILDVSDDQSQLHLTGADWTLISSVIHAFDIFSPVSEMRSIIERSNPPLIDHLWSAIYNSLELFVRSMPDFQVLTLSEQYSLLHRNMLGLLSLGSIYFVRELGLFAKPENEPILLLFYGNEMLDQAKRISEHLNPDSILLKLMLVVLACSSNCFMISNQNDHRPDSLLSGTFRILGSQNVYVDLVWKYLCYTYDHAESIRRFSTLVTQLLSAIQFGIDMYEKNTIYQNYVTSIIQRNEASSNNNDRTDVPLWGKKV